MFISYHCLSLSVKHCIVINVTVSNHKEILQKGCYEKKRMLYPAQHIKPQ